MSIFGELRKLYKDGENISTYLKENPDIADKNGLSASDAIAISYDLQAGSYVHGFYSNYKRSQDFNRYVIRQLESAHVLTETASKKDRVIACDFGTGEATNYNSLLNLLPEEARNNIDAYGMDISLSRIDVARNFSEIEAKSIVPKFFLGDLKQLPLIDNAIDIAFTMHAFEPNGGAEKEILSELIRVTKHFIVLAEPIYETATPEQRKRMEHYGYIQQLRTELYANNQVDVISESLVPEELCSNTLNRTTIFIAKKKVHNANDNEGNGHIFACPISRTKVLRRNGFWLSNEGSCYPEINGIPVLRSKYALPYYQQSKFSDKY